ncbi:stalk domain-containing protein [Paenibacillus planticolens]|uniref:Copper amine oxidase-like N-terminal domain-containing protein n=1 Tax=Paenibacillus planticolens TaxID=2654976 RepID=A0ABX1ZHP0_9BACL|nr:stalk domain-containing protein [Paenibacillus planticolens]NOU99593.1 hypothetical protein [Paenibacillus planticolens]
MKKWMKKTIAVSMTVGTLALPSLTHAEEMMMPKFDYSGVETITKDGSELAPLRKIAESLGFQVTWNEMNRSITLMKSMMMDDKKMMDEKSNMQDKTMMDKNMDMGGAITIQIDSQTFLVGMKKEMLMVAPTIVNDMAYVPKEFIDTYLLKEMKMMK